jgi:hypothetical protein
VGVAMRTVAMGPVTVPTVPMILSLPILTVTELPCSA